MAGMSEIDIDVESVRSSVSGVALSINDSEGSYSAEWLTVDCISNAFQTVNTTITDFESAKGSLMSHLDELDAIAAEIAARVKQLNDFIARFPSRRNNATASVSAGVSSLNVRKAPGTNNPVVGYASGGAVLKVVGKDENGWTEVELENGTRGYVATKYININTNTPEISRTGNSNMGDTAKGTPQVVGFDKKADETPAAAEAVTPTVNNNEEPQVTPTNSNLTAFVNTRNSNLNIRKNPGTDQPITGSAIKGTTLKVLEEDKGNGWTKVQTEDGTVGYVSTNYLRIDNKSQEPTVKVETKTGTPSLVPEVINTPQESGLTAFVNTRNSNLNIRKNPGTDQPISGTAIKGSTIKVLEEDKGNGWTKVQTEDGTVGYVSTSYLRLNKGETQAANVGTNIFPASDNTGIAQEPGLKALVNTNNLGLNVRTGKGTNNSIITSAAKGSTLTILEKDDGSGWAKVQLGDGTTGYVLSSYLDVNSANNVLYNGTAMVNTSPTGVNLMSGANGNVLAVIPGNTKIEIGESVDGWTRVKYDGHEGYVATELLSNIENGD